MQEHIAIAQYASDALGAPCIPSNKRRQRFPQTTHNLSLCGAITHGGTFFGIMRSSQNIDKRWSDKASQPSCQSESIAHIQQTTLWPVFGHARRRRDHIAMLTEQSVHLVRLSGLDGIDDPAVASPGESANEVRRFLFPSPCKDPMECPSNGFTINSTWVCAYPSQRLTNLPPFP